MYPRRMTADRDRVLVYSQHSICEMNSLYSDPISLKPFFGTLALTGVVGLLTPKPSFSDSTQLDFFFLL